MHRVIVLAGLLAAELAPLAASAAETVFLGQKNDQTYTGYENCSAETDTICMTGWYRWTIRVERTVSGPRLPARIVAIVGQHAPYVDPKGPPHELFVVRPIDDPEARERMHADYLVDEESQRLDDEPKRLGMYCMQTDPKQIGLNVEVFATGQSNYCFTLPPVPRKN